MRGKDGGGSFAARPSPRAEPPEPTRAPPKTPTTKQPQNNPILLGDPGVGKTAIAEGLAYCIVHGVAPAMTAPAEGEEEEAEARSGAGGGGFGAGPLPAFLREKRVLQLDVGLLIAGAKVRGELESRVTRLMQEIRDAGGNVSLM